MRHLIDIPLKLLSQLFIFNKRDSKPGPSGRCAQIMAHG